MDAFVGGEVCELTIDRPYQRKHGRSWLLSAALAVMVVPGPLLQGGEAQAEGMTVNQVALENTLSGTSDWQLASGTSGVVARCVRLTALREINNNAWTSAAEIDLVNDQGQVLDQTGWAINAVDSQELVGEDGAAANAIDGNDGTLWHTQWSGANPTPPHHIDIDLGSEHALTALQYLPRQDGVLNGTIADYQVFVSPQCTTTWTLVADGSWSANTTRKTATLAPTSAPTNQAPVLAALADQSVTVGATLTMSISASDADGPAPLVLTTSALPGSASFSDAGGGSGTLSWTPLAGDVAGSPYSVTVTATDGAGMAASQSFEITVVASGTSGVVARCVRLTALREINNNAWTSAAEIDLVNDQGQVLDQTGWTINAVDSQELVGEDGAAANAIDGNDGTLWHTQWSGANPTPPHHIDIDLGSEHALTALQYLPRQDGVLNGTIADYQVFVSPQCTTTWTLVADGTWNANTTRKTATLAPASPPANQAPVLVAIGDRSVTAGETLSVAVSASDADGPAPLVLTTSALPGSASFSDAGGGSGTLSWTPLAGDVAGSPYSVTVTATDGAGMAASQSFEITVVASGTSGVVARCVRLTALREINNNAWTSAAEIDLVNDQGQVLDQTGWAINAVDSQELVGEDGAAANAIDGNDGTLWHTQWSGANPTPPHHIDIDLGSEHALTALQYLPRQDGVLNGTIADYQVFVSPQCTTTWTLVADGTWNANTTRKTAALPADYGPAPTAGFSADAVIGLAPFTVTFADESTGSVDGRHWDFGDGVTGTAIDIGTHVHCARNLHREPPVTGPSGTDTAVKQGYTNGERTRTRRRIHRRRPAGAGAPHGGLPERFHRTGRPIGLEFRGRWSQHPDPSHPHLQRAWRLRGNPGRVQRLRLRHPDPRRLHPGRVGRDPHGGRRGLGGSPVAAGGFHQVLLRPDRGRQTHQQQRRSSGDSAGVRCRLTWLLDPGAGVGIPGRLARPRAGELRGDGAWLPSTPRRRLGRGRKPRD